MVKSHEKNFFSYDGVVKYRRNLNFEKMHTAWSILRLKQGKMMGFNKKKQMLIQLSFVD